MSEAIQIAVPVDCFLLRQTFQILMKQHFIDLRIQLGSQIEKKVCLLLFFFVVFLEGGGERGGFLTADIGTSVPKCKKVWQKLSFFPNE